jgi:hypothetical protein
MRANDRNRAWIVVVLLFIFMVINFADNAVGIAAVPIMQELKLGPRASSGLSVPVSSCCSRSRRSRPAFLSTGCRCAGCCWRWGSSER